MPIENKEIYEAASFQLIENEADTVSGDMEIRGRGNSTWKWPKKPYRIKLSDAHELLGMPRSRHWVLLANYADKTLIRNDVAFTFSRNLGFEYTVSDKHIELYLNGEYEGIYQLVEQIRLAENRINIDELDIEDTDPLIVTGGYLMELDLRMNKDLCKNQDGSNAEDSSQCMGGVNLPREQTFCVDSMHDMSPVCLQDPDYLLDAEASIQRDFITQYIRDAESALFSESFGDPQVGYSAYMDVDSLINYYLINEFFKNVEGAKNSFYIYKKRDGKLFFGPVWDFDIAMGSNWFENGQEPEGWVTRNAPWFSRLFEDPNFAAQVRNRWQELEAAGEFETILRYIEQRTEWMNERQRNNFIRWPFTTIELWLPTYGSYQEEAEKLVRWQRARYEWLSTQFQ